MEKPSTLTRPHACYPLSLIWGHARAVEIYLGANCLFSFDTSFTKFIFEFNTWKWNATWTTGTIWSSILFLFFRTSFLWNMNIWYKRETVHKYVKFMVHGVVSKADSQKHHITILSGNPFTYTHSTPFFHILFTLYTSHWPTKRRASKRDGNNKLFKNNTIIFLWPISFSIVYCKYDGIEWTENDMHGI